MRRVVHAVFLLWWGLSPAGCVCGPGVSMPPADRGLAAFAPMAGVWRAEVGGSVFEETWTAPAGGNMTGSMRAVDASGVATLFELMTVEPVEGGYRLRLRHFDAALNPWASEADGPIEMLASGMEQRVASFNDHDAAEGSPRTLRYDLSEPGRMHVLLDFGPGRDPLRIRFGRVR